MLRSAAYRSRPRKLQRASGRGGGSEGRALKLQEMVTNLIRYERIESTLPRCDEARGYTEQLISLAVQNGDKDRHTMEMADYWLTEKDLIHKLFKVLVPRYNHFTNYNYTQTYRLPNKYPGSDNTSMAVLELKFNPWPPVVPNQNEKKYLLTNILLRELNKSMKKEGKVDHYKQINKVTFPNEYAELKDNVSPAGNHDTDSVGQSTSRESEDQLASTESIDRLASADQPASADQLGSTESADRLGSTESADQLASTKSADQLDSADQVSSIESEQLASPESVEQSNMNADEFQNQDNLSDPDGEDKDKK
ncbi:39S ribosomal protein L17, mitochondrial-like [Mizuhopecten yessoensis]|uniref:39S ribosomal protein L17, mitochondrial-like n=1 Tax=Mizuhopecten yessoensis TaxID=6573 RepID=UPI000B45DFF2|nr:39S ribosomal protein L17, mitochondrial-like [Mizuhopecten yessoensis]